jgi:uncharacterized membrane protein YhfC
MVLVAGLAALSLLNLLILSSVGLDIIPAAQRPQVVAQLRAVAALPGWVPLLGAWERLWTVPVQVALSVIVLQVFRRRNIGWLWLAILAHVVVDGVVDGVTSAVPQFLGAGLRTDLIVEGIVAVFGLIAIWIIFALRDRMGRETATPASAVQQPG